MHEKNTLIPPSEEIERYEIQDELSWVLIVEKEVCSAYHYNFPDPDALDVQAIFQTLCHLKIAEHPDLLGPGLLITVNLYYSIHRASLMYFLFVRARDTPT